MSNSMKRPEGTRRDFLDWGVRGLGATALISLMQRDLSVPNQVAASETPASGDFPNFLPKAKRAIQICLIGGLSHLDSFDYKPELKRLHGKSLNSTEQPDIFFGQVGLLRGSDWEFKQRGESGLWISELFPHLATQADRFSVIRSMVTESANHTPALFFSNSGFQFNGFPSMGSWLSYGLGNETETLPTYVVLPDDRGGPNGGASNWSSGFLPGEHQGIPLHGGENAVRDLFAPGSAGASDFDILKFLTAINEKSIERTGGDPLLLARIKSYETAARMQLSVPEVTDLAGETQQTLEAYGVDSPETKSCGRRCLLARRLIERGVRFVQVFSGGPIAGSPRASWDAHENVLENHSAEAKKIDQPVAALIADLGQRGLLEDTLVLFTTEFGRTPFAQSAVDQVGPGRDHNRYAFSIFAAGAGLKAGTAYGSTDDIGWKVGEKPVTWHDFHATILHLFGVDHTRLTYYHNGIQRRLTNVHGEVIREILG